LSKTATRRSAGDAGAPARSASVQPKRSRSSAGTYTRPRAKSSPMSCTCSTSCRAVQTSSDRASRPGVDAPNTASTSRPTGSAEYAQYSRSSAHVAYRCTRWSMRFASTSRRNGSSGSAHARTVGTSRARTGSAGGSAGSPANTASSPASRRSSAARRSAGEHPQGHGEVLLGRPTLEGVGPGKLGLRLGHPLSCDSRTTLRTSQSALLYAIRAPAVKPLPRRRAPSDPRRAHGVAEGAGERPLEDGLGPLGRRARAEPPPDARREVAEAGARLPGVELLAQAAVDELEEQGELRSERGHEDRLDLGAA